MFDTITVRGFAATKPDLRTLPDGTPVASFRLASTPRRFDAPTNSWVDVGPTNWYTVSCFRRIAGNAASSLNVGDAVLVQGRLRLRPWTAKDGGERLSVEIDASSLGPDLALGTATYKRAAGAHAQEASRDQQTDPEEPAEHGEGVDPMTGEVLETGRTEGEESSWEGEASELLGSGQRTPVSA